jgi:hypothetical protein
MDDLRGEQPRRRRRLFSSASQAEAAPSERSRRGRKDKQDVNKTTVLVRSDDELDDEFAALIGEEPQAKADPSRGRGAGKPAKDAKKSTTGQLDDDMDLRDLL